MEFHNNCLITTYGVWGFNALAQLLVMKPPSAEVGGGQRGGVWCGGGRSEGG